MVQNTKVLYLLSFLLMLTIGCEDTKDDDHDHDHDETIEQPTSYTFPSRFVEGESSVSYTGQVVRNMLHTDLKASTDRAAVVTYMAADALMDFFDGDATSNSSYISSFINLMVGVSDKVISISSVSIPHNQSLTSFIICLLLL